MSSDLQTAARLWYDRTALLQHSDPVIRFLPDAVRRWKNTAESWISDEAFGFFVAIRKGELIGFVVVTTSAGKAGLHPENVGAILEMAVDLHRAHSGLSELLLSHAKGWLAGRGIGLLEIDVPARYPVEEAFWRAQRAHARSSRFCLEL